MKPRKSIIIAIVILLTAALLVWWNSGNNSPSAKPENESASEPNGAHGTTQAPHPSAADRIREQPQRPNRPNRPSPTPISLPTDTNEIRNLTPKEARELVRRHKEEYQLSLNGLTSLDAETASVLAEFEGHPHLETAQSLAEFKGGVLSLEGLTSLDAETAQSLAEFEGGELNLSGLTSLDAETVKALAKFKGNEQSQLSLNGLTSLDAETAQSLAEFKGDVLSLYVYGLTKLTPETVKALAKLQGKGLDIDHLNAIARSSQAARGMKSNLPKDDPSRMPKRPAQVTAHAPVAAPQSGTPAWQWLLGAAFLLSALVVYLSNKRRLRRAAKDLRPSHGKL